MARPPVPPMAPDAMNEGPEDQAEMAGPMPPPEAGPSPFGPAQPAMPPGQMRARVMGTHHHSKFPSHVRKKKGR